MIRCRPKGNGYVYGPVLDRPGMQALSRMMLPELTLYSGSLAQGCVTVTPEDNRIASMHVPIRGEFSTMIAQIPIRMKASFLIDRESLQS